MLVTARIMAMEANISLSAIGVTLGVVTGAIIAYHKASKYFAVPINQLNQTLSLQEPILRTLEDAMTAAKEKGIDPYQLAVKDVNKELIYFSKTADDLNRIFHDNEMGSYSLQGAYEKAKTVIEENRKKLWELQNQTDITTESTDKATDATTEQGDALDKNNKIIKDSTELLKEYGLGLDSLSRFDPTGVLGKGLESLYDIEKRTVPLTDKKGLISPEAIALMQEYLGLIDPYEARIQAINSRYAETEQQLIDMGTAYDKEALAKAKAGEIAEIVADRDKEAITERRRLAEEEKKIIEDKIKVEGEYNISVRAAEQSIRDQAEAQKLLMASAVPFAGYVNLYDQLADMVEAGDITTQEYIDSVEELNKATEDGIMTNMEYAESFGYIETIKARVKENLDEGISKYTKQIADDWEDIKDATGKAAVNVSNFWDDMKDGVNSLESRFYSLTNGINSLFSILQGDPIRGDYGGISDYANEMQKEYDDLISGQRDFVQQQLDSGKTLEEANQAFYDEKTKMADKQKEAEMEIIKDFQFSQLSLADQQAIKIEGNYDTLKDIYKKYGMDVTGLERDKQKALRDLEIQGYADSLGRIADYVQDAKTIWDGLISTWEVGIDVYNRFIKKQGETPDLSQISTGTGGGGGGGGTDVSGISIGKAIPLVATGIALYQGYKNIKNNKERLNAIESDLMAKVDTGEITPAQAQYLYFSSDPYPNSDADDKIAARILKQIESQPTKYTEGNVRTRAGTSTASASLAPPQTVNLNVYPASPKLYNEVIDTVTQGLEKKGIIVHSKRF